MQDTVLILTNSEDDLHVVPVIERLERGSRKFFRFDSDRFAGGEQSVHIYQGADGMAFTITNAGAILESHEVRSVWYRRPTLLNLGFISDIAQRQQTEAEINGFLEGMYSLLNDAFWLSNPAAIRQAQSKIFQLSLVQSMGFATPKTLVTNNPEEFWVFWKECSGNIVYKTLKQPYFDYENYSFVVPTTKIGEEHLANIELIKFTPALFQELLEKRYEVRVTVVGEKVFAVTIDSQAHEATSLDWRNAAYVDKLNYELIDLPPAVEVFSRELVRRLGLLFGAIDFVVNRRGDYVFLEINPNGQWQWLEYFTGAKISESIADVLV